MSTELNTKKDRGASLRAGLLAVRRSAVAASQLRRFHFGPALCGVLAAIPGAQVQQLLPAHHSSCFKQKVDGKLVHL